MDSKLQAVEAYERWWNTRPEPHISAPRQCAMQEDKMMAVWLSAWDACEKEKAHDELLRL